MALSNIQVYSQYAYTTMTEIVRQQIELFNAASNNAIVLSPSSYQGDYSDVISWARISGGMVRRRNAYGTSTLSNKNLTNIVDTMVKVAAGTFPIEINPETFTWIQKSPEEAGVVLGQQLAVEMMADMVNTAIGVTAAALSGQSAVVNDISGATAPADKITQIALNNTLGKFGDRRGDIKVWVLHSDMMRDLFGNALTNGQMLFKYDSVNIVSDPFGNRFLYTDCPSLLASTVYTTLGLVQGAVVVGQNNDYTENFQTTNGKENIEKTYQAQWTYQLGIKGFQWDKTNGGKSPTDAALFTSTNWDASHSDKKDFAGVLLKTH